MRLAVDLNRCQGFAQCAFLAPDVLLEGVLKLGNCGKKVLAVIEAVLHVGQKFAGVPIFL